jgi:hypothetical protein
MTASLWPATAQLLRPRRPACRTLLAEVLNLGRASDVELCGGKASGTQAPSREVGLVADVYPLFGCPDLATNSDSSRRMATAAHGHGNALRPLPIAGDIQSRRQPNQPRPSFRDVVPRRLSTLGLCDDVAAGSERLNSVPR